MKEENKQEIKKGILAGAGTAAGAIVGSVIENTFNPVEAKAMEVSEAEVVDAMVEESSPMEADYYVTGEEVDHNTLLTEGIISEAIESEPEKKPVQSVNHTYADNSTVREEVQVADSPEMSEVEVEEIVETVTEPEMAVVEDSVEDEDIMIVSIDPDGSLGEEADGTDATPETADMNGISVEGMPGPDYADIKDNDLSGGSSMISAPDMPDYVNDANIDSFTGDL